LYAAVLVVESNHCWIFFVGEDNYPNLGGLIPVGLNDDLQVICRDSPIHKLGMGMLVPRHEDSIIKLFTVLLYKWVRQTRGQNDDLLDAAILGVYCIPQWLNSEYFWIFFVGEDNDPNLAGLIPIGLNDYL
jgi:hypothetical protein